MKRQIIWLLVVLLVGCGGGGEEQADAVRPQLDANTLFYDNFAPGQTGAWLLEQDEVGKTAVLNEQLAIEINAPNTVQYSALANELFDNFVLTVDVSQLQGSLDSSYGVLFRMVSPEQFYRFAMTSEGTYVIERRENGRWLRLSDDWPTAPAINQGLNVANEIKITAVGATLTFFVNGIEVQQVTDSTYSLGGIALDAGTFGHTGLQVAFDNVQVSRVGQ
ncbi:MAG: hypothetical protein KDE56_19880 [Anaerolineales bacterium]|nr:hypothetical protein [Anaerolineales bacterium]